MTDANLAQHIDRQAARFLRAVEYYGGEATTTEIRQRTGLSRDVANHRFRRLDDLGLIEVTDADEGYGDREPPKVAHLTGLARKEIERGLFRILREDSQHNHEVVDIVAEVRELRERVDHHQNRLNTLSATQPNDDQLKARLESVEAHLDELDNYVIEWNEAAEQYLQGIRAALEEHDVSVTEFINS